LHEGHRTRLKERFLRDGLDNFEKHEVLEILLYYVIPRKNTNDIAHRLLDAFGSLSSVFDAPIEALSKIEGVGRNSATLIKLLPELSRRYLDDKYNSQSKIITNEIAGQIFVNKFIGRINEHVILMLLDSKRKLLFCGVVSEGTVNAADIYVKKIVELALRYNASTAIVSHNHPSGIAMPSKEDILTTIEIKKTLDFVNIKLIDHIIVADNDYVSLADSKLEDLIF
jgi:DNA repair protein RadC